MGYFLVFFVACFFLILHLLFLVSHPRVLTLAMLAPTLETALRPFDGDWGCTSRVFGGGVENLF